MALDQRPLKKLERRWPKFKELLYSTLTSTPGENNVQENETSRIYAHERCSRTDARC
jgi:hypothetical protein